MSNDFARLSNNQLRLASKKLYKDWWYDKNKEVTSYGFGAIQGLGSCGITVPITAMAVESHSSNASAAAEQYRLCTEELHRRGLQPLECSTLGMVWTSAWAFTVGAVCCAIPGAELTDVAPDAGVEAASVLVDAALSQASASSAEEGGNKVPRRATWRESPSVVGYRNSLCIRHL